MFSNIRYLLFASSTLEPFGSLHCIVGEGLPLALQNRFVSEDSLTVRFLVVERICGETVQDNKNGN